MAVAVAGCIFCTRMDSTATRISSPMDKAKTRPVFHSATNAPEITVGQRHGESKHQAGEHPAKGAGHVLAQGQVRAFGIAGGAGLRLLIPLLLILLIRLVVTVILLRPAAARIIFVISHS